MKRKNLLLENSKRLTLGFILLVILQSADAQRLRNQGPLESFLQTQFWLGFRLGVNATDVTPDLRNTGFSPINYDATNLSKDYEAFTLPGMHVGLEMNLYHNGFSISFQPLFKRSRFEYSSQLEWTGDNINSSFFSTYKVEQKLDLIELPMVLKYDIIQRGKIRPFIMAGGFFSIISSAQKELAITQTDNSSGRPLTSSGGNVSLGVKNAFQNFYGAIGGVGVNLDLWNIRSVLEVGYHYGLSPFTKENAQQEELIALGESNDELTMNNLNISLSLIFPFRFIDASLRSR